MDIVYNVACKQFLSLFDHCDHTDVHQYQWNGWENSIKRNYIREIRPEVVE